MKIAFAFLSIPIVAFSLAAQQPPQQFTDALGLLQAVAHSYSTAVDSFRFESIIDSVNSGELRHEWSRTYRTALKGPGNLYRIEVRTNFGSYTQVSDGVNEWVYQVDTNAYVKRPVPQNWPEFPKMMDAGLNELKQAWNQRTWLEEEALGYKRGSLLPEETIIVEGRHYSCYVVHVTSDDSVSHRANNGRSESTFWIDKQGLVFRKKREIFDGYIMVSKSIRLPWHGERTELYPVVDLSPQTTPETFRFNPPEGAKEVASVAPDFGVPPPADHPKADLVGQMAPDVTFAGPDGVKVALSSYRGKPVLIDFWATWCGPCLLSMPALNRIYAQAKEKGLVMVSFDQNEGADDGSVYLAHHHYDWKNYHDEGKTMQKAFKGEGIPLTVLLDGQGKIVYYDFGGDEAGLRKAIAGLGPQFVTVAQ